MEYLRLAVFAVFLFAVVVALGSWAVTTRRISPFGGLARLIRSLSDPVLVPLERWMLRRGANPQNAPWWFLGLVIVGGIILLTLTEWLLGLLAGVAFSLRSGPRATIRMIVLLAGQLVSFALIARVIGSWFGVGRFNRWMRPAYRLTDWIVEPLRRVLPPVGMIDFSPLVAWLLLQFIVIPVLLGLI